jgi:tetratricopeptide (TPR) repeat protein
VSASRLRYRTPINDDAAVRDLRERWDDAIDSAFIVLTAPSLRVAREALQAAMPDATLEWFCLIEGRTNDSVEATISRLREERTRSDRGARVIDLVAHTRAQRVARDRAVASLNFQRDFVFRDPRPTIVLLLDGEAPWFSAAAPDLWSFRQVVLQVRACLDVACPFLLPMSALPERTLRISFGRARDDERESLRTVIDEFREASRARRASIARAMMYGVVQKLRLEHELDEARPALELFACAAVEELDHPAPNWTLVEAGLLARWDIATLDNEEFDSEGPSAIELLRRAARAGAPSHITELLHDRLTAVGELARRQEQLPRARAAWTEAFEIAPNIGVDRADLAHELALLLLQLRLFDEAVDVDAAAARLPRGSHDEVAGALRRFGAAPEIRHAFVRASTGRAAEALDVLDALEQTITDAEIAARWPASEARRDAMSQLRLCRALCLWIAGDSQSGLESLARRWFGGDPPPFEGGHRAIWRAIDALGHEERDEREEALTAWTEAFTLIAPRCSSWARTHERFFARSCASAIAALSGDSSWLDRVPQPAEQLQIRLPPAVISKPSPS